LLANCTLNTAFTLESFLAHRAGRSRQAVLAVFHVSQPRAHQFEHLAAQRRDLGAHRVDAAVRLRFDQRALALPLTPLLRQHFAERLAPRVKQSVGGQCVRRR